MSRLWSKSPSKKKRKWIKSRAKTLKKCKNSPKLLWGQKVKSQSSRKKYHKKSKKKSRIWSNREKIRIRSDAWRSPTSSSKDRSNSRHRSSKKEIKLSMPINEKYINWRRKARNWRSSNMFSITKSKNSKKIFRLVSRRSPKWKLRQTKWTNNSKT